VKLFERYLGREVLLATLLALLALTAVDGVLAFIAEMKDVGRLNYGTPQALQFVLLTLPGRALDMLPVAALLGGLIGLGRLAAGSELVVLRAAGVSRGAMVAALLKLALVLMVFSVILGEVVVPPAERYARTERAAAKSGGTVQQSLHGVWARDGNAFIYIRELLPSGQMKDVTIYQLDGHRRLRIATHADAAHYDRGGWILDGLRQSLIDPDRVITRSARSEGWASLLRPELLGVVSSGPDYLSALSLVEYISYLQENGLDAKRYELALWNRIVGPLSLPVMLIFALPFVLGPLRDAGGGKRILFGILLGIGFYLLNRTYYQLGQVYGFNPIVSAAFPTVLFLAIALYALRRTP